MQDFPDLTDAIQTVPTGRWAVGVSGGADSVALLRLLCNRRSDLHVHVVHLDHQTRAEASTGDAAFVAELARSFGLPITSATRVEVERDLPHVLPNVSEHFRTLRHELFRRAVAGHRLDGVLLAHHADDVAETVFQRLLRGSGPMGLTGIAARTEIGGLTIVRPLLTVRRDRLRTYLTAIAQPWREDASNDSAAYLRNRLRVILSTRPQLNDDLHSLADACAALREWVRGSAIEPADVAPTSAFAGPAILARETARRWLAARGVPIRDLTPAVIDRLLEMANDAATSPRQQFPGNVTVARRRGTLRQL